MTMPDPEGENRAPRISIILPVLNEADGINEAISRLRALDSGRCSEIIVADADPSGGTISAIGDGAVRTILSERGRARQMNRGAAIAAGDVLLFLHADTILPPKAFSLIQTAMRDQWYVAGAFDLGFDTRRKIFKVTEQYVFLRTRLTKVPFGDQAIFIRRDYFEKIGGYREIPIMEDVELMSRIRKRRGRIRIIPAKALTSPRRYEREGLFFCTLRNWLLQTLYMLGVPPERLAKWYPS
ncbi:MAG TPA: TIGR04283 family arsenosugar biosynthesis glycosyltransferase [Nitrospirota bacterium]